MKLLQIVFLLLLSYTSVLSLPSIIRSPIIIIPGFMGSQLQARLDKPTSLPLCKKKSDWYTLWIDLELVVPAFDKCFADNAKLLYDSNTNRYLNATGVDIRVPGFGGTDTIEYLDQGLFKLKYFHTFVQYFEKLGYKKGIDIRGAPYDWRLSPDVLSQLGYYDALYELIETTYTNSNNTPVTLIAHSYGGPISMYFLKYFIKPDWKLSRIKQFVSLSAVFGGNVRTALGIVSGDNEGLFKSDPKVLREAQRTYPSQVTLLPTVKLWGREEVIVSQPKRNYTAYDYNILFADLKYSNGTRMLNEVQCFVSDFTPPNITHYCFYGNNVSTPATLVYGDSFPDQVLTIVNGNGDGTVNECSLKVCQLWNGQQSQPVIVKPFSNVSHLNMTMDVDVLNEIAKLVIN